MTLGEDGENLAFLLGIPRSGTTLLSAMLDRHPRVLCPPEPWFLLALEALGQVHPAHPADPQLLGDATRSFCSGEDADAATRAHVTTLLDRKLAAAGRGFFVDKTPRYFHILPYLRRLFPKARFVWLIRDPLDVAASYKTTWHVDIPQQLRAYPRHRACIDLVLGLRRLRDFAAAHPEQVLSIQYEALVAEPQAVGERVVDFLGLPPAGNLTEFDLSHSAFGASPFGDKNILATSRPHQKSVGSWERAFAPEDVQTLLDAVGSEMFHALGYGPTLDRLAAKGVAPPPAERSAAWLQRIETALAERLAEVRAASSLAGGGLTEDAAVPAEPEFRDNALSALLRELRALRPEARRLDAWAHDLVRQVDERDQRISERDQRVADLEQQLARLSSEAQARAQAQAQALEAQTQETHRLAAELAAKAAEAAALREAKEWLERPGRLFVVELRRARNVLRRLRGRAGTPHVTQIY